MKTNLDHIVIGAASLEQGVDYVKELLGVEIPKGGEHPAMGTHNHLMQLGGDVFLEVIAINPAAPAPPRPRWYGLDDPYLRCQLNQRPQLLTWVVNVPDIVKMQALTPFSFGEPVPLSRGDLRWLFGIPDDGRLLAGGLLPYLIQWQTEAHPAKRMGDVGCRLDKLEIHHPQPDWIFPILSSIHAQWFVGLNRLAENTTPYLEVHIETPSGIRTLRTCGG